MMSRITVGLVTLVGLAVGAAPALAAKAYGPEEEALIRRGIEYRKALDDLSARAQFQKAYDLTHSPFVVLLAKCRALRRGDPAYGLIGRVDCTDYPAATSAAD